MRFIFVGSPADTAAVEQRLDAIVGSDWRVRGDLHIVTLDDCRNPLAVRARLKDVLRPAKESHVYLLRPEISFERAGLPQPMIVARPGKRSVFLKNELRPILRRIGADWFHRMELLLEDWDFPEADEVKHEGWAGKRLDIWLRQFDRVAKRNARWVGEGLVRSFELIARERLVRLFQGDHSDSIICVMRYENGKSADALSGLIKKAVLKNAGTVENFNEVVRREAPVGGKIVVYEDGLFSGTEWVGIFKSFLGCADAGSEKFPSLKNPDSLKRMQIELRFAIATNVGVAVLRSELDALGLTNVVLKCLEEEIDVLSEEGRRRLAEKTLLTGGGLRRADIQPRVFQTEVWGVRANEAMAVCEVIGRALWSSYWTRKEKVITEDKLNQVALGASNMGFAMTFAHSLPKVSLPVFWCAGEVTVTGHQIQWMPLFPNAA
ncbi:phosphoribosyltransferase-like protein [Burkholderia glumae]|uniref:PRTase-CE domain-containing protein n=1 Tax=Burkholderia glumae TaxID=337 RepID=A0AAP9Y6Y9_BURGL|nr:hypothetical protein [Burkholderia glumae]AJY62581.1 hypothetical protein KS03_5631 [Burkholderia glumae LMG 2196 = ATCC 33617]QPQ94864.1 hypothetical protein I6H06_29355 [Burkholderia glumae]QQM89239.1 hypothetical protein I6G78_00380 [Burkholderia glumae]